MAQITLPIDPGYPPDWDFWSGIRELVQNAKDGDEFDGHKMTIEHLPRSNKLVITNEDVTLDPAMLLILGKSSKRGGGQRGKFGEGFVLGCLALVRAGHSVTAYNGDEVLRPSIFTEETGPFEGSSLLRFTTRKKTPQPNFAVEIENVSKETWAAAKKLFLFLEPPKPAQVIKGAQGRVLLNPDYQGMIFARGIFVNKPDTPIEGLECGYDLDHIELDRDRRVVDEFNLRYTLASLWTEVHASHGPEVISHVYEMIKKDALETRRLSTYADDKLVKALYGEFEKEHGDAVPVTSMTDSRELESMGQKTVVAPVSLVEVLEKSGRKVATIKEELRSAIKTRYSFADLPEPARYLCEFHVEPITDTYIVVTFNNPDLQCRYLADEKTIAVSREYLESGPSRREVVRLVARAEAQRRSCDISDVLINAFVKE